MKFVIFLIVLITSLCIFSCTRVIEYGTNTASSSSSSSSSNSGSSSSGSNNNTGSGPTAPTPLPPATTPSTPATNIPVSNIGYVISSTSPCSPSQETFTFRNTTIGVPATATYEWYFGDGNSIIGAGDSIVTNQYMYAGNYKVNMKILYNGKTIADTIQKIVAFGPDVTPLASFDVQQDVNYPNIISFNNTSTIPHGSLKNIIWNFGDGSTGSGYNVKHTYTPPGSQNVSYKIKLTATGNSNCSDTATQTVIVPKK